VLYSGFAAIALCVALPVLRRERAGVPLRAAVPAGYGVGLIGVAIFLAGGVADMIWHTLLGIEVNLEALLSPPHLVLLTGGLLMVTTPLRAAAARPGGLSTGALPAIISLFAATAVAAFFLTYVSPFGNHPLVSTSAIDWQATGLAEHLVTTVLLVMPVIGVYARGGRIPAGLITAVTAAVALPLGVLVDFAWLPVQIAAVIGGVAADVVIQVLAGRAGRFTPVVAAGVIPVLVWSGYLIGVALSIGVGWPLELWAGMVLLTGLGGAAIGWFAGGADTRRRLRWRDGCRRRPVRLPRHSGAGRRAGRVGGPGRGGPRARP
jgi:hypothetical protein